MCQIVDRSPSTQNLFFVTHLSPEISNKMSVRTGMANRLDRTRLSDPGLSRGVTAVPQ
jgi:hypothetical protein